MADEKENDAPEESDVQPITQAAGIPWLPGRGNKLRSKIPPENSPEDEGATEPRAGDES